MPSTHRLSPAATPTTAAPCRSPPPVAFAALPDPRAAGTALRPRDLAHPRPRRDARQPPLAPRHRRMGTGQDAARKRAMGFAKGVTPHQSTFQRLFHRLDPAPLSAALSNHAAENAPPMAARAGRKGSPSTARRSAGDSPSRRRRAAPPMP
jgi:hypothetical protein